MKKTILFVMSLIGIFLIVNCNSNKIENQWMGSEIAIDGNNQDWSGINQHLLEDQNIVMNLANDENNFYIVFSGNDEKMVQRIRMMGARIWLNGKGKKTKGYGICYTGSTEIFVNNRPEIKSSESKMKPSDDRMPRMPEQFNEKIPKPGMIMFIHGDEHEELAENNTIGPTSGSFYKNGVFCYEFKIPLPVDAELGKTVTLGLELGGISDDDRKAMRPPDRGSMPDGGGRPDGDMGGGPGGMGGRPGGMGGRPGGPGGPGGERPQHGLQSEKQEVWFTVVLAQKSK